MSGSGLSRRRCLTSFFGDIPTTGESNGKKMESHMETEGLQGCVGFTRRA